MASAKLTQVVGDYMISMVGTNMTEHLTERLRILETENAQLRASQLNPSQQEGVDAQPEAEINSEAPPADESGTHTPCRTTNSQVHLRSPLQPGLHKPPAPTKLPTFTPTPPSNQSRTHNDNSNLAPLPRHQPSRSRICGSDPHSKCWNEKVPTTTRFSLSMRG